MKRLMIASILTMTVSGYAQDVHFTQTMNTPLMADPSMTGVFDGAIRANLNYRGQWKSVQANYQTYALQFDHRLFFGGRQKSFLAYGLNVYRDVAGSLKFGNTRVIASVSSALELAEDHTLSIGIGGGFGNFGLDMSNALWRDNTLVGTNTGVNPESSALSPANYWDFSAGMTYWWSMGEEAVRKDIKVGLALHHFNRPTLAYYGASEMFYRMRLTAHFDGDFDINRKIGLLPSLQYSLKGPHSEFLASLMMRYRLKDPMVAGNIKRVSLLFGATARFSSPFDAIAPMWGMEMHDFLLLMSYDVNVSNLSTYSRLRGGFEISLRYILPSDVRGGRSSTG